jgi:amino acid efflux transporter
VWSGLELTPFILGHTSSMVAIYAVGMVAAVRLLRRGTLGWWMAVVAAVLCAGMLVLAAGSLLPAAILAAAAVAVTLVRRTRRGRTETTTALEAETPRADVAS